MLWRVEYDCESCAFGRTTFAANIPYCKMAWVLHNKYYLQ